MIILNKFQGYLDKFKYFLVPPEHASHYLTLRGLFGRIKSAPADHGPIMPYFDERRESLYTYLRWSSGLFVLVYLAIVVYRLANEDGIEFLSSVHRIRYAMSQDFPTLSTRGYNANIYTLYLSGEMISALITYLGICVLFYALCVTVALLRWEVAEYARKLKAMPYGGRVSWVTDWLDIQHIYQRISYALATPVAMWCGTYIALGVASAVYGYLKLWKPEGTFHHQAVAYTFSALYFSYVLIPCLLIIIASSAATTVTDALHCWRATGVLLTSAAAQLEQGGESKEAVVGAGAHERMELPPEDVEEYIRKTAYSW